MSNVQIAKHVGFTKKTVARVHHELEMTSKIAKSKLRIGVQAKFTKFVELDIFWHGLYLREPPARAGLRPGQTSKLHMKLQLNRNKPLFVTRYLRNLRRCAQPHQAKNFPCKVFK